MTLETYAWRVADQCGWEVIHGTTANGTSWTGIKGEGAVAPVLHLDELHRRGVPPEVVAEMARKKEAGETPEIKFPMTWEEAKGMLYMRLLPRESNPEVWDSAGEYFGDLALCPYVRLDISEEGSGTTSVSKEMLRLWQVTKEDVMEAAEANTIPECEIRDMAELIAEMVSDIEDWTEEIREIMPEDAPKLLVCTNRKRQYGAVAAYYLDEKIREYFGTGYTVLPSSVHEMIVINRQDTEGGWLNRMVREVNETQVERREWLSDHTYEVW